jgi:hypothetical protein
LSFHGAAAGTSTDVTGSELRYKRADNDTADLDDTIPIPSSGAANSWAKSTRINWTTTPGQVIKNLRWYADPRPDAAATGDPSSAWVGVTIWAGACATYTQASSSDESAIRAGITATSDVFDVSNPLIINGTTVIENPDIGMGTQEYLVTQVAAISTCVNGVKAQWATYMRYEEI